MKMGNCLKYLKRRWNREEGRGNKDFKKRGKVDALKREMKFGEIYYYYLRIIVLYVDRSNRVCDTSVFYADVLAGP